MVSKWNRNNEFTDSVKSVKKRLSESEEIESKETEIKNVMKLDLKMRYKKLIHISVHANSAKNLILRQQFALQLIKLLMAGKTILNVDESWLGMTDFRRRKWRKQGSSNSHSILQVQPRISIIAGLDTKGNIYYSLIQSNTNVKIIEIFLQHLVKKLDAEQPAWRRSTVLLLDNASYHTSGSTQKVLKDLQIPCLYTGPNSYLACPIELLFASLKADDINPRKVPTGK